MPHEADSRSTTRSGGEDVRGRWVGMELRMMGRCTRLAIAAAVGATVGITFAREVVVPVADMDRQISLATAVGRRAAVNLVDRSLVEANARRELRFKLACEDNAGVDVRRLTGALVCIDGDVVVPIDLEAR